MPQHELTIKFEYNQTESKLFFDKGESLLLLCQKNQISLFSPCGGNGSCGKCRVKFTKGAPLPSAADRKWILAEDLRKGYRLACRVTLSDDCEIAIPESKTMDVVTGFNWEEKIEVAWKKETDAHEKEIDSEKMYFVAIDIGTTTIVMEKRSCRDGSFVECYKTINAQRKYGADVLSRLEAAMDGHDKELAQLIGKQIEEGLKTLGRDIRFAVLSANTTMIHLLMGYDVSKLAKAPFKPERIDEIETEFAGIKTYIMPGFSAFVGADIFAGILATQTDLVCKTDVKMLIDLGTNAEIALFNSNKLICTSTAAGCAFDSIADQNLFGADVISILYDLYKSKMIDEHGTLADEYLDTGIKLENGITITQEHIRQIQLAKAAVRCGIDVLAEKFGCSFEEIDKVYLAGGFGYYLDIEAAAGVGLLPKELKEKAVACGNTALAGAALYGAEKYKNEIDAIYYVNRTNKSLELNSQMNSKERTQTVINLASEPAFEQKYIQYIDL